MRFGFVSADDRITEPMIRTGSEWRRVSWEEAVAFTADRLRRIDRPPWARQRRRAGFRARDERGSLPGTEVCPA